MCCTLCTQAAGWSCHFRGFLVCSSPSRSWCGQPPSSVDHQLPSLPLEAADCRMCPARLEVAHPTHCFLLHYPPAAEAQSLTAGRGEGPSDKSGPSHLQQLDEPHFHPQQMPLIGPTGTLGRQKAALRTLLTLLFKLKILRNHRNVTISVKAPISIKNK